MVKDRFSEVIAIRVTQSEKDALIEAANREGKTLSSFIRYAALIEVRKILELWLVK